MMVEDVPAQTRVDAAPRWWRARRDAVLRLTVVVMTIAAAVWLAYEYWRLLREPPPRGPMDLRYRLEGVQQWFAGTAVYRHLPGVLDPPATQVLLWPLLGWLPLRAAQWMWACTSLAATTWMSALVLRHSRAAIPAERTIMALLPFAVYATGATIGNGQIGVHLLPALVAGCLLLARDPDASGRPRQRPILVSAGAAALVLFALAKPSISAPFFWIVLFVPVSPLPALLVTGGYAALTLVAAAFQPDDLVTLLRLSLARESAMAVRPVAGNVANLHVWFGSLGLDRWILPASAVILAGLGAWVYRHRRGDIWLLLGVTGYVARFWSYHRWYDDGLIMLPVVALFRLAHRPARSHETGASRTIAGALAALTIASLLAPGGLFLFPPPWNGWYVAAQLLVWLAGLLFLARQARERYGDTRPLLL
jgi:hypothetical protein